MPSSWTNQECATDILQLDDNKVKNANVLIPLYLEYEGEIAGHNMKNEDIVAKEKPEIKLNKTFSVLKNVIFLGWLGRDNP